MADFTKRALTIATVGLLSGSPITIATDGLIQQRVVEPPVVQPVVTAPSGGVRGPLEVHYENVKRVHSLFEWGIRFTSYSDYEISVPSEYKHVTRNFYDVVFSGDYRKPAFETYGSKFVYALSIDTDFIAEGIKPAESNLVYTVSIKSDVYFKEELKALWQSEFVYDVVVNSKPVYVPLETEANAYSFNSSINTGVNLTSVHDYEQSSLSYFDKKTGLYYDVKGKTLSKFISADSAYYKYAGVIPVDINIESYAYVKHAPVDVRNEEEELFLMLAQILVNEEEDG